MRLSPKGGLKKKERQPGMKVFDLSQKHERSLTLLSHISRELGVGVIRPHYKNNNYSYRVDGLNNNILLNTKLEEYFKKHPLRSTKNLSYKT